jgi:HSP20 family protein
MGWDLAVDVFEEKGNVIAEMNLPGITPDKVNVTFENGGLKITGSREEEKETKEKNFYCKEIHRGKFERMVELPVEVKKEKAEAHFKNGVLRVVIPKKEEVKPEPLKIKVE